MDIQSTLKIRDLPEEDRPREKLERLGPAALTNAELIAILLRTGRQGASAVDVARSLIKEFPNLTALKRAGVSEIAGINGIGPAKAVQLAAAFALGDRIARETVRLEKVDSPEMVERLLGGEMRGLSKESLRVILLNTKLQLVRIEEVSLGSLNQSVAHPREIFRPAIVHSAYGFVLVHNHPSGDPTPSRADRALTRTVHDAARLMDINFMDHIIIGAPGEGRDGYYSFKENGLL
jgi:DNA repair protein RadC